MLPTKQRQWVLVFYSQNNLKMRTSGTLADSMDNTARCTLSFTVFFRLPEISFIKYLSDIYMSILRCAFNGVEYDGFPVKANI